MCAIGLTQAWLWMDYSLGTEDTRLHKRLPLNVVNQGRGQEFIKWRRGEKRQRRVSLKMILVFLITHYEALWSLNINDNKLCSKLLINKLKLASLARQTDMKQETFHVYLIKTCSAGLLPHLFRAFIRCFCPKQLAVWHADQGNLTSNLQ